MPDTDIAIIGAGAAGLSVAAVAAQLGLRVTLIERGAMGGDCLNTGCVPSKALLAAGHAAAEARRAARFGVRLPAPEIVWPAVRAHVRGAIAAIEPNDSVARFERLGCTVVQASARFVAPDALEAGGRRLTFRRCVIAAGSAAVVPALPGLAAVPYLTNETLFDLEQPPGHLLILGGGPIGLEMAQAHARLGCQVTVLEAGPRVAGREDPALAAPVRAALAAEGVVFREAAQVVAVEPGPVLVLAGGERIAGTHLLLAVGRAPRLAGLDLAAGRVAHGAQGVSVGRDLRSTSNRRVWAVGDIADVAGLGPRAFTHVASQHASVLVRSMLFRLPGGGVDYAALPRVTYTDPELCQVGLTEAEARAAGHAPQVLEWHLAENDRAVAEARTEGLAKLVLDAKGRLLGGGVTAPRAGEMAGVLGLMLGRRLPLSALAQLVVPYPTLAEALKRAAGTYYAPKLFAPGTKRLVRMLAWWP
jgi:pyruvate/2-oxoglutarate dehydrogenase complex dihydrolipoamide dehydrogenase (E3) component